ncbi:Protein of unknown function [Pseudarcicella hirudinis]|uniref:Acyl carrier protein n=1 Tax=Pseudarcicella hirudinis TaxID=1079859 RepID=A0A1I5RT45_9BACT|nr:DUF1493 family protein [Pseudarcicella hirudinis]SFP61692.1 Protein of unknown function [Pseudarcicella hirudinis]
MELTFNNLLCFLENKYSFGDTFNSETILRDANRECPLDGGDALDLLLNLGQTFNVTFETFDFHKYFLDETELNTMTWKHLFGLKRQREIKEELTIKMLFDYMITNAKSPE